MPRPSAATTTLVRATTSFVALDGGIEVPVKAGDLADSDAPVVRKYPTLWEPAHIRFASPRIEQATAAPGEKRGA